MRKDMDLEAEIKALVQDKSPYEPRLLKLPEGPSSRINNKEMIPLLQPFHFFILHISLRLEGRE
jgi:hypothetical protein